MGWRRGAVAPRRSPPCRRPAGAQAQEVRLPVLVPLTGFVALEGTSQRNGALLAASQIRDVALQARRARHRRRRPKPRSMPGRARWAVAPPLAVIGPILGTQMLALLPLARSATCRCSPSRARRG